MPMLLLVFYALFCRYDPSVSNNWFYDFLSMNTNVFWFLLVFTVIIASLTWIKKEVSLVSLIAVVLLFSLVQVATNYPMIFARDVFLQGSIVNVIGSQGHIGNTWNTYAQSSPSFFVLWSVVTIVTGLEVIPTNLFLLLPIAIFLFTVLLVLIFRKLSIAIPYTVALFAFLLMNFNKNEYSFLHFNTRLLAFIYVLAFVFIFIQSKSLNLRGNGRGRIILLFIIFVALVTTHVLIALLPFIFITIYWLLNRRKLARSISTTISFVLGLLIVYTLWNFQYSSQLLKQVLTSFLNFGHGGAVSGAASITTGWFSPLSSNEPFFGFPLDIFYKVLLICLGLISIYAAFRYRHEARTKILGIYLFSVIFLFGFGFFFLSLGDVTINRGIILSLVAISPLVAILITSENNKSTLNNLQRNLQRKSKKIGVFAVLVAILIVPQFVFSQEIPIAPYASSQSLNSACNFVVSIRGNLSIAVIGYFPAFYTFYEPFFKDYVSLETPSPESWCQIVAFYQQNASGTLKITDYRAATDYGVLLNHASSYDQALADWTSQVNGKLDGEYDRIYDNDQQVIYR